MSSARIHTWDDGNTRPFTEDDYAYPLHTVLNDGDVVHFDADYHPRKQKDGDPLRNGLESIRHAKLDWFSQINTDRAKICLIHYFKEKYEGK